MSLNTVIETVRPKDVLPRVSSVAESDVLIFDGVDGLKGIAHADYLAQLGGAPATFNPSNAQLKEIVSAEGYELTAINFDSDGVVTTATVLWPDGSAGVFTVTLKNPLFFTIDAYTVTHASSNKTVTQAAVTRDSSGNVTAKPALTVS